MSRLTVPKSEGFAYWPCKAIIKFVKIDLARYNIICRSNTKRISLFVGFGKEALMTDKGIINESAQSSTEKSDKRTYTVPEIMELLQISKSKAYELCQQNLFRTIKIGRSVRVSKISFDEWLDKQI